MKLLGTGQAEQQLLQMLGTALQRQDEKWIRSVYKQPVNKDVEVSPEQRDEIVSWLITLNRRFAFYPETLMLSVAILDKFLHSVKVRPKYLRCVGITCFYLAAKTCEEDEVIPATSELVEESECGRTVSEVLRMEPLVLDKLGWDLNLATPLHFIHIFHALMMSKTPHLLDRRGSTPSRQIAVLTEKLVSCLGHHAIASVEPSVLAAALISLELEALQSDWLPATVWLQTLAQCDNDILIRCREQVSHYLSTSRVQVASYPPGSAMGLASLPSVMTRQSLPTAAPCSGAIKRKVEEMEVDEDDDDDDDIYDGIKLLYNEDDQMSLSLNACGREIQQDIITSPRMTTVVN